MAPDDQEINGELVEAFLRYLRGRGPRPAIDGLPEGEQAKLKQLFELMDAIVDSDTVLIPPIDEDPVAIRLGLVGGGDPSGGVSAPASPGEAADVSDPVSAALDELVFAFAGEVHVSRDTDTSLGGYPGNGLLPARAVCRTLADTLLLCLIHEDDFSDIPRKAAHVFTERPMTTAVAIMSVTSREAVVLTEADCVRAVDPIAGWVDPHLPRPPEPLGLALRRYLQASLPRWDEVGRLDDMLDLGRPEEDVSAAVGEALHDYLGRTAKIPAKRTALSLLRNISPAPLSSVANDVRMGLLADDRLLERIRDIAQAGTP